MKVVDRRGDGRRRKDGDLQERRTLERSGGGGRRRRRRSAGFLNGVRDKKQIRFTHSRFPLANSISSGVPLTLCP